MCDVGKFDIFTVAEKVCITSASWKTTFAVRKTQLDEQYGFNGMLVCVYVCTNIRMSKCSVLHVNYDVCVCGTSVVRC